MLAEVTAGMLLPGHGAVRFGFELDGGCLVVRAGASRHRKGESGNELETADLDSVAIHLKLARDPLPAAHELSGPRLVVELVSEFGNPVLQHESSFFFLDASRKG